MADNSFDTLSAAHSLRNAGIGDEQATAIVGAMQLAVANLVTVDRFEAGMAELRAEIATLATELRAEMATLATELRAEIVKHKADYARMLLTFASVIIGANALVVAVVGIVLSMAMRSSGT